MPTTRAAAKALRQTAKRRRRNLEVSAKLKKVVKQARIALQRKQTNDLETLVKDAVRTLDRAARKGVITKNAAARKKSRLVRAAKTLGQTPKA